MTGLLQKDFYNLRTAIKNLLLILVIFIAYLIFRKHEFILPLVPVLLSSSLLTTVINLDRHSKWNMLMITEYSARDCAARPLKLSIHSGGIEHACRRR